MMPVGEFWKKLPLLCENGILPWLPVPGGIKTNLLDASPYLTSLEEVDRVFAYNKHRKSLMNNLVAFRKELHYAGILHGIQWIGGSFIGTYKEEPADIDVITFARRPEGCHNESEYNFFKNKYIDLFSKKYLKSRFKLDHRFMDLEFDYSTQPEYHYIRNIIAFYSLFSNCEITGGRKGFVAVSLNNYE